MVNGDELDSRLVPVEAHSTSESITLKIPQVEMEDVPCGAISLPPHRICKSFNWGSIFIIKRLP